MKLGKPFALKLIILFLLPGVAFAADTAQRILFVGNSYTSVNDLPNVFQQIVGSTGAAKPKVKASTPGGRTFAAHLQEERTLTLINEGNWDVVILQGNSQEAAISEANEQTRTNFLAGASNLCQRVRASSPKAKIVFYQTWARHGDHWKAPEPSAGVGRNPTEMQARTRKWYQRAATQNADCAIAPVGDAWELNYQNPGAIRLHKPDNSHPEWAGSYLAGLALYGIIYHPAKLNVAFRGQLSDAQATYLQGIAAQALQRTKPF
jgi:hypothetical protein